MAAILGFSISTKRTRSDLIQALSVFISRLDWLAPPGHHAQHLCAKASKSLLRALDGIFDDDYVGDVWRAQNAPVGIQEASNVDTLAAQYDSDLAWIDSLDWSDLTSVMVSQYPI